MTYKKLVNKKLRFGFTLVELLVYMALMGIFLVVLLEMFTLTLNTKLAYQSTSSLAYDSRYILSKFSYDIGNADSIISPTLGSTSASLQLTDSGVISTYSLNSGNLTKTVSGVSANLNGVDTGIDSITFKNIGNIDGKPTIQITYTVRSNITVKGGNEAQTITTTVGTR